MEIAFLNLDTVGMTVLIVIGIIALILPVIAIVRVLSNRTLSSSSRLLWIALILLAPYLGAIIYFVAGSNSVPHSGDV